MEHRNINRKSVNKISFMVFNKLRNCFPWLIKVNTIVVKIMKWPFHIEKLKSVCANYLLIYHGITS